MFNPINRFLLLFSLLVGLFNGTCEKPKTNKKISEQDQCLSNEKCPGPIQTNLLSATDSNDFESVVHLLKCGADPNVSNNRGITPLMYATMGGQLDIVKELLKCDANPSAQTNSGITALHYGASRSPDVFEVLLSSGANPNAQNRQGETPLIKLYKHPVANFSNVERRLKNIKLLLQLGRPDPYIKDIEGKTAMDYMKSQDFLNHHSINSQEEQEMVKQQIKLLEDYVSSWKQ